MNTNGVYRYEQVGTKVVYRRGAGRCPTIVAQVLQPWVRDHRKPRPGSGRYKLEK